MAEEQITEGEHLIVEAFKTSKEFNDVRVAFNHETFNTTLEIGFDYCHH